MAAPMRMATFICQTQFCSKSPLLSQLLPHSFNKVKLLVPTSKTNSALRTFSQYNSIFKPVGSSGQIWKRVACAGAITFGVVYLAHLNRRTSSVFADVSAPLKFKPIRCIRSDTDSSGLKLTLFQYQTCPFCCKVRAYLDYHGFSYNVVEVNSVWRTQTKWTKYKKVPILVVHGVGPEGYLQINDSSVIISALETYLVDKTMSLEKILECYPSIEGKNQRGKTVLEFPNKYFVMFNEQTVEKSAMPELEKERKWRAWNDDVLVHAISPNIYRTMSEALQSFRYFSEVGQWEKVFSTPERLLVIYVGTAAMYMIGKMLKKRHSLKDDVRESLYDACREWVDGVGRKHRFMGGDEPNMADLSVYGTLNAMEGCIAFGDVLATTKIGPWFYHVKKSIQQNVGQDVPDNRFLPGSENMTA